jgi:hypothetical protein
LQLQHSGVASLGVVVEQVGVRSLLHDLAVLDDGNDVGVAHGGETVRHDDGGAARAPPARSAPTRRPARFWPRRGASG